MKLLNSFINFIKNRNSNRSGASPANNSMEGNIIEAEIIVAEPASENTQTLLTPTATTIEQEEQIPEGRRATLDETQRMQGEIPIGTVVDNVAHVVAENGEVIDENRRPYMTVSPGTENIVDGTKPPPSPSPEISENGQEERERIKHNRFQ